MQKWIKHSRYGRLTFAIDYSRAEKLVNGLTENFPKITAMAAVQLDYRSATGLRRNAEISISVIPSGAKDLVLSTTSHGQIPSASPRNDNCATVATRARKDFSLGAK
jgi:hypothetical protein